MSARRESSMQSRRYNARELGRGALAGNQKVPQGAARQGDSGVYGQDLRHDEYDATACTSRLQPGGADGRIPLQT